MATETVTLPQYVHKRGNSWRYRRVVPDGAGALGTVWTKTWNPRRISRHDMEHEAAALASKHDFDIAVARGEIKKEKIREIETEAAHVLDTVPPEHARFNAYAVRPEMADQWAKALPALKLTPEQLAIFKSTLEGTATPSFMTIIEAVDLCRKRYPKSVSADKSYVLAGASFVKVIGNKPIDQISRDDAVTWRSALEKAHEVNTANLRIAKLAATINTINRDEGYGLKNPFAGLKIKGGNQKTRVMPFHKSHIDLIDRYLSEGTVRHDTRNVLRLTKLTGCRPAEIGGLAVADVILDAEIPYLAIRPTKIRRLKNNSSERQIPLLGDALLAARDAVERAMSRPGETTDADNRQVFEVYDAVKGRGADNLSHNLNAAVKEAGVPKASKRLVANSYRHSMKEALRAAKIDQSIQDRIMGHASKGMGATYGAVHGQPADIKEALGLAIDMLGDIDLSNYLESEKV